MSRKRKNAQDELQPTVKLTSDGDLLVKNLLAKQLSTQSNLQSELHHPKVFIPSTDYKSMSEYVSGVSSFDDLEQKSKYLHQLEEFMAAGLTEKDMLFYLDKVQGIHYLQKKHKNLDIQSIEKRLQEISDILHQYRIEKNIEKSCSNIAGRLETECMLSSKPNSVETNLLKFALNNEKKINELHNEIEPLKVVEKDFMKTLNDNLEPSINLTKLQKKVQRRLRAMRKKVDSVEIPQVRQMPEFSNLSKSDKNSKWDVTNMELATSSNTEHTKEGTIIIPTKCCEIENLEKCNSPPQSSVNRYTIRNGSVINLKDLVDYTQCKKLSLEEIISNPKFSQYSEGIPSKILYMKNVHCLSLNDLEQLFHSFKLRTKAINLMKGRMRGQAFVEMESTEQAKQALQHINGLIMKNKPVIIQFSTKTVLPQKD